MVRKGEGRFDIPGLRRKKWRSMTGVLYIESKLTTDSAFPLKAGDKVEIEIDESMQALIVRRKK